MPRAAGDDRTVTKEKEEKKIIDRIHEKGAKRDVGTTNKKITAEEEKRKRERKKENTAGAGGSKARA